MRRLVALVFLLSLSGGLLVAAPAQAVDNVCQNLNMATAVPQDEANVALDEEIFPGIEVFDASAVFKIEVYVDNEFLAVREFDPFVMETQLPTSERGTHTIAWKLYDTELNTCTTANTYHVQPYCPALNWSTAAPLDGATYSLGDFVNGSIEAFDASAIFKIEAYVNDVFLYMREFDPYTADPPAPAPTSVPGTYYVTWKIYDTELNVCATQGVYYVESDDSTDPTISLDTPPDGTTYTFGQQELANYTCADEAGGSGIASCDGDVANGVAIDTLTLGERSFTVDAFDNAGNHAFTTHSYTVIPAPFAVTSADPSSLARGATRLVHVYGSSFVSGDVVAILGNGVTVGATSFIDSTHLTVPVTLSSSAALSARDVRVTKPAGAGTATCTGCFTVNAKPTITALSPTSAPRGATLDVSLTGSGLQSGALVTFSGTGITVNPPVNVNPSGSALTLSITIDAGTPTGARTVTVTNPDGGVATKTSAFTVNALPTTTSLLPSNRAQGVTANVVITGTGYLTGIGTNGAVSFGDGITVNTLTRNSATKLTANISIDPSASVGSRDVTVTNPDGGSSICSGCFAVNAAPTITAPLAPDSLAAGATHWHISVTGTGFQSGLTASLGSGVTVHDTGVSPTGLGLSLDISVSNGAAPGPRNLTVTNPDGGVVTCVACFTVNPKPSISTLSPNQLPRGTSGASVIVTGAGFRPGATVGFSGTGVTAEVISFSPTALTLSLSITPSASTGWRSAIVRNPDGGVVSKGNAFRVLP